MYYVYVLYSLKSKRLYTGYTDNLRRRIKEHNSGHGSSYTNRNRPYRLVFYEALLAKQDAINQEQFYKSGYGKEVLKEKIINSLKLLTNAGVVQQ